MDKAQWKVVPVEPTDGMVQAAHHIDLSYMPGQEGADRAAIYRAMLAAAPQPPSASGRMSKDLRDFIEGMSVSVDVSTGDHDADHRLFGTISEVMDEPGSKHGVILLMHDQEPNFEPPSASGEREAFEAWHLAGCEMVDDPASRRMDIAQHCAWEAWQARAALAPSPKCLTCGGHGMIGGFCGADSGYQSDPCPDCAVPGVDAAEQKPVPFRLGNEYRTQAGDWVRFVSVHNEGTSYETMADEKGHHRYTRRDFGRLTGTAHDYSEPGNTPPLYIAPSPAASADEWMAEAERLVDDYAKEFAQGGATYARDINRAALLAHLRTKPSTESWCDTMSRPKSKCGCPDCGPSLIDLGPGLRNTPGKP